MPPPQRAGLLAVAGKQPAGGPGAPRQRGLGGGGSGGGPAAASRHRMGREAGTQRKRLTRGRPRYRPARPIGADQDGIAGL